MVGVAGRMGKTIVSCIEDMQGVSITGGTEYPGHDAIGSDIGEIAGIGKKGISVMENIEDALTDCDAIIDFTTPETSILNLGIAVKYKKSIVIGTTGFSVEEKKTINQAAKSIRCVLAPNMSIGVNVLLRLQGMLRKFLTMLTMLRLLKHIINLKKTRLAAQRFVYQK